MLMKTLVDDKCARKVEPRRWANYLLRPARLLVAVGMLALSSSRTQAVVINFETSQGFSGTDGAAFGGATPAGIVTSWGINANYNLQMDHGPGGSGFGDEPVPISGSQIGLVNPNASGVPAVLTIDLDNSANLSFNSFWYANRGTYPPVVKVEYFGLNELSLGTDTFTGAWAGGVGVGLDSGFNPKFQLLTATASFQGVAMSKVIITSDTSGTLGQGAFSMDDITLNAAVPEPSTFALMGLGGIVACACRRGKR
jgi:hypothetical protein